MTLKSDAKFEEKLFLDSKIDMRNSVNFNESSSKSENLHLNLLLLSIAYKCFSSKSTEELSLMTLRKDLNFEEKQTFCLKNDMKNLVNFNSSSRKSENLHFNGLLLKKICNVWAKKVQRSCVVENDLWFQKWHKEFGEFAHK